MARYVVDKGVVAETGVKMRDGTVYRPSERNSIEVTNRRHIAEIEASSAHVTFDMISEHVEPAGLGQPDNYCGNCMFNAFLFSKTCPRCGAPMTETEDERS
jgi:hypothetical protein